MIVALSNIEIYSRPLAQIGQDLQINKALAIAFDRFLTYNLSMTDQDLDLPRYLKLLKMGKGWFVTVPIDYIRNHKFDSGPAVKILWQPGPDGVKLSFMPAPPTDQAA
jgi:hypothetical protein